VTNLAYATGSFNSIPVISPSGIAIIRYEQPTKKEKHNEGEHICDRDHYGGPDYGGYGDAVIPMILDQCMEALCMAVNLMGMAANLMDLQKH
jgi:hypothetical protein